MFFSFITETAGFKIDTMSSYHGMSLKSVTEGGGGAAGGGRKAIPPQQHALAHKVTN